jgi:hypothetical protein
MSMRSVVLPEALQEAGEPVKGAVVFHRDTHHVVDACVHAPDLIFDEKQLLQKLLAEVCKIFRRSRHPQPFMRALEQRDAEAPLGFLDPMRQCRWCQAQNISRVDNPSRPAQRPDHLQMPYVEPGFLQDAPLSESLSANLTIYDIVAQ